VEFYKNSPATSGSTEKLRADYDKLKDVFKRSEVTWLKERQALLNEIDQLRDGKPEPGYNSMRPDRDLPETRDGKVLPTHQFLSTYGSTGMRTSPHRGQAPDSSHSKSKKILS